MMTMPTPSPEMYAAFYRGVPPQRSTATTDRRAFALAKLGCTRSVALLDASTPLSAWLALRVRKAERPDELLRLRNVLFAALRRERPTLGGDQTGALIALLGRRLDRIAPDGFAPSGFGDSSP